jgi:Zn-finger nucleic acid-binding protein
VNLNEKDRADVTIDYCPECRGVWLDRGELEKILARESRELEPSRKGYRGEKRRKSWFENISDLIGG